MNPGHEMILASAGSGKTYALTNRFVKLLTLGAKPERIVALTFTRKAAGEFFDAILHKLAHAARDPQAAAKLATEIGVRGFGSKEFLKLLREVADSMHRLRLGTFDGFFAGIVRNFPFELGLSGEFEVLEEHAAKTAQARVLRQLLSRAGKLTKEQHAFIEAFKLATFGREEKRLTDKLVTFLQDNQEAFLAAPASTAWGDAARIWPEGCEWLEAEEDAVAAIDAMQAWLARTPLETKQAGRWADFLNAVAVWQPGAERPRELDYVLFKALESWDELKSGGATLKFDRKAQELDATACAALVVLVRRVMHGEYLRRLAMTRGLWAVIAAYETIYHETVRRAGRLTFADVQRLLLPAENGGRVLSAAEAGEGRLLIDYRLDAGIDHWLLDEFQDTSHEQWSVLKNLIDEAVQDSSAARSFFYVGDVKQSIYEWRGGDPRLMREIFDFYNAAPGTIAEQHLDDSWRSCPPIIAMVNAVFGAAEVFESFFPGGAGAEWNREWRDHRSARESLGGQAALLLAEDKAGRFATTLALLRELPAPRPDFSVAVLVQRNDTAAELADYLRREGGIAAVAEADLQVCADNPVGAALLSLVHAAAFPGDTLAWEHVQMSPLGGVLAAAGVDEPEKLTRRVLGQIADVGFAATLHRWWQRWERAVNPDAFTRRRVHQFLTAAAEFDESGRRDVAEFGQFMTRYTLREPDSAAVVRVMTIHKSKGLGFDVVILPDLEGQKLEQARGGLAVHRNEEHDVEWVLDLPPGDLAAADPVLSAHLQRAESRGGYEKLSLFYVAMTRAKRGLYAVIQEPKKSSTSRNFPRLLMETLPSQDRMVAVGGLNLPGAYSVGDSSWHSRMEPRESDETTAMPLRLAGDRVSRSHRLVAKRPSDTHRGTLSAGALFAAKPDGDAREFGRTVHALFAQVAWLDGTLADDRRAVLNEQGEAGAEVLACLMAPALASIWAQVPGAELWRERAFEAVIDGVWITGIFDRVVVERDAAGKATRATVYDFKTDEAMTGAVERHAHQLELYRAAAAQLAGLPSSSVACFLVMTRARQGLEVTIG
ncbi:MAG: UvrD-helicase domain-containing protein [Opitutaceae bacterium]